MLMLEWLSSMTRTHVAFACGGSNLAEHYGNFVRNNLGSNPSCNR